LLVAFNFRIDSYTEIYNSTHLNMIFSKHKNHLPAAESALWKYTQKNNFYLKLRSNKCLRCKLQVQEGKIFAHFKYRHATFNSPKFLIVLTTKKQMQKL